MGSGEYLVGYALRGGDGVILETVNRAIDLGADETLSYWDSLTSQSNGVTSCDIRRLELDQEVCTARGGCTVAA